MSRVQIQQITQTDNPDDNPDQTKPFVIIKLFKDKKGNYRHLITTREEQLQLLKEYHDNPLGGHQGHQRTLAALQMKYYWPKMKQDVINYVNTCVSCNQRNTSPADRKPAPMQLSYTPKEPFQHVAIDIVGPLPTTKNVKKYLLTFQDVFSKYPEAIAIPDQTVQTITKKFVTHIMCRHGCPKRLTTDQGSRFTSELFSEVCKLLRIA